MNFRQFFTTNRLIQRLFSRNVETRHSLDEIIVHPNPISHDASTSETHNLDNFEKIESLMDFFETFPILSLLKETSKVLILKFETITKPTVANLEEFSQKCLGNSIVILLALNARSEFCLYWKSKQIRHFLTLKHYERGDFLNDVRLFEFLANFIGSSLKRGHLGLLSKVPLKPSVTTVELHFLADYRGYNLLLVTADEGDVYVLKLMLTLGLSSDYKEINAQTLAWKKRHFEVLSILLKSNLVYPSINIDECPNDIKEFYEVSRDLNEAILSKNEAMILNILSQNPEMIHFYNLNNESALAFALKHRLVDMYKLLISKNIIFGPHEKFSKIKKDLNENERVKLREIHYKESKILPDNHMHVLLSNSRLGHDTSDVKMKYETIQNAFEILNGNPFIQIILMIVAASRNFRIIFDFNRDSVEVVDPTVDDSTDGLFYLFGRVYIAAKKLLNNDMKFEALGVLAHELCHYAMSLVYKNLAKPYFDNDFKTKNTFEKILNFCIENTGKERIVDLVHECYPESAQHAELIVRVPHLIMKNLNDTEKLNTIRSTFYMLFEIYENKIFKEMKEALPRIEAIADSEKEKNQEKMKIMKLIIIGVAILSLLGVVSGIFVTSWVLQKPIYKFSNLPRNDQIRVENAPVIYKDVNIKLKDLFPQNSNAYDLLTSDDISSIFDNNLLDFGNSHLFYLNELVSFEWKNLTKKLKAKFLTSNLTFQNESVSYKMMNITNQDAFNSLKSQQIIDILDGIPLNVHKIIRNESAFYTERSMFSEYIYIIYYKFMTKLNGDKTQHDCIYKNKTGNANETFESFYQNYQSQSKLNFVKIMIETNTIVQLDYFSRCFVPGFKILNPITGQVEDSLLSHKALQIGFEEILIESGIKSKLNSTRIFLFSSDAGTGKTETFRQLTLRIKRMYPDRWVSYIDYGKNKNFDKIETIEDVMNALLKVLEINLVNQFERFIFEEFFMLGKMILLWDGYEKVISNYTVTTRATKILEIIHSQTTNIQFVATRPSRSDKLRRIFKIEPYTFVPLDKASINDFLHRFFVSQKIVESEIPTYVDKVQRIVNSTKSTNDFNTPLPLGMIAYVLSNDREIFKSENLYQIYQRFVEIKLHIWLNNVNGERKLIESLMMSKISVPEIYQKYALRIFPDNNIKTFVRFLTLKLKISSRKFSKKIKINQISEMGILFLDDEKRSTFAHSTFIEFFIAQYIIQNVFKSEDDMSADEAELKIKLLYWSMQNCVISVFVESYFHTVVLSNSRIFDPQIVELFLTKYKNFMVKMLQTKTSPISTLMQFFKKDHMLLTHQLQIDDSNGVYRATYNFANFNIFNYKAINRSDIRLAGNKTLTKDEYKKFISLKDHKGIILYSMYCIKQFFNSSAYARQSIPEYDLSDEIFDSNNMSEVLTSIVQSLNSSELTKFIIVETVWHVLNILDDGTNIHFRDNNLEFFETLLDLIEEHLSIDEQKKWISKIIKFIFLLKDEATREFLSTKVAELLSDSEILDLFSTLHILHFTATIDNTSTPYNRFNYSWNFFIAHSNQTDQRSVLKQLGDIECYLDHKYTSLCYLVPKINLLHVSLIAGFGHPGFNSTMSFQKMLGLYKTYFNDTELQDLIIAGSKEFIPFLIIVRNTDDCKLYADFLSHLFKGNDSKLAKFLLDPIKPTMLNIFDLLSRLYYSKDNFEIFKRLTKKFKKTN